MRWTRRAFIASTLALLATPAILRRARADALQLTLKLHHSFSAVSAVHEKFLAPWARKVEADSGGRIRIDLFPSMQLGGAPAHLFDQARDGVADIVWAVPSATPGRRLNDSVTEGSCPEWLTESGPAVCVTDTTALSGTSTPVFDRT